MRFVRRDGAREACFGDAELNVIRGALRVASEIYKSHASDEEQPQRIRDQFSKQAREADLLLEMVDE